jgi:lipopolysaccharide transport system ATP-binding protein
VAGVAIRIEGLGKRYRIGRRRRAGDLREALAGAVARSRRALTRRGPGPAGDDTFWALRDITLDVEAGEVLGIIGPNGAGKSTLLKILSRITEPTTGRVEGHGRVGSLLEVGTGFHPDLTGRENVYLNGSILGMRKAEVDRKFDEIIDFSGIERFLDTPVKRYSSGMFVRLAFAVAAHLEPEILIVDEVLSVGDSEFQRRCLNKMEGVARGGRTVLMVSHNMGSIQALCSRAVLLKDGRIITDGTPTDTLSVYLRGLENAAAEDLRTRQDRFGDGGSRLVSCEINVPGGPHGVLQSGKAALFSFDVDHGRPGLVCWFGIYDQLGDVVACFDSRIGAPNDTRLARRSTRFTCTLDELLLLPGRYRVDAGVWEGTWQDRIEAAAFFDVEEGAVAGRPATRQPGSGNISLPHHWAAPT